MSRFTARPLSPTLLVILEVMLFVEVVLDWVDDCRMICCDDATASWLFELTLASIMSAVARIGRIIPVLTKKHGIGIMPVLSTTIYLGKKSES
jgi:hypothetical protein